MIKYKVSELAKQLNISAKEVSDILKNYLDVSKKSGATLTEEETNVVFEYFTHQTMLPNLNAYYASASEPLPEKPAKQDAPKTGKSEKEKQNKQPKNDSGKKNDAVKSQNGEKNNKFENKDNRNDRKRQKSDKPEKSDRAEKPVQQQKNRRTAHDNLCACSIPPVIRICTQRCRRIQRHHIPAAGRIWDRKDIYGKPR